MSKYRTAAAERQAVEEVQADRTLMCAAHGCPNRWTVQGEQGRCCSAHAASSTWHWPRITEEQQQAAADRALRRQLAAHQPETQPQYTISAERRRELWRAAMEKLGQAGRRRAPFQEDAA